jgi:hypothetical protein
MLDVHARHAYYAGIMKKPLKQYTIRQVPERVDLRLREAAATYGTSINSAALQALSQGLGVAATPVVHHDLDDLIGSWVSDPECDQALAEMDRVDPELWS